MWGSPDALGCNIPINSLKNSIILQEKIPQHSMQVFRVVVITSMPCVCFFVSKPSFYFYISISSCLMATLKLLFLHFYLFIHFIVSSKLWLAEIISHMPSKYSISPIYSYSNERMWYETFALPFFGFQQFFFCCCWCSEAIIVPFYAVVCTSLLKSAANRLRLQTWTHLSFSECSHSYITWARLSWLPFFYVPLPKGFVYPNLTTSQPHSTSEYSSTQSEFLYFWPQTCLLSEKKLLNRPLSVTAFWF